MLILTKTTFYLLLAIAILGSVVAVLLHYYFMALGMIVLFSWLANLFRQSIESGIKIVAIVVREKDKNLQNYIRAIKKSTVPRLYSLFGEVENKALKNFGLFGQGGAGKSKLLSFICLQYSDPYEVAKYGMEPVCVFAFNYHKFQKTQGDFDGLNFHHVDISKRLPHVFNPEYKEFLIRAFKVVAVNEITSRGIMSSMLEDVFRDILDVSSCTSWDEFEKNCVKVEKQSTGVKADVCNIIRGKVSYLNVGQAKQINFNFKNSVILDYSNLPNDLSKNLYSEFYANLIYHRAEAESIAGRPHSVMLVVDECHRLTQHGIDSILVDILRNSRKHMRVTIATQNFTDVNEKLRHFQHIQFKTHNDKDIQTISTISPLHADAVRQLSEHEFVWINDGNTEYVPVFKLETSGLEKFRNEHPPVYDETDGNSLNEQQPETDNTQTVLSKIDTEAKIVELLEKNEYCMYYSEIATALGYPKNSMERLATSKILKRLADGERILEKDYITPTLKKGQKPRRYYFAIPDGESQLHRTMVRDVIDVLTKMKVRYEEGKVNQGYDVYLGKSYIELETSLKNSLKEYNDKVTTSDKFVLTIVCNEQDRERYSYLSCVKAGKTKIVLLNELANAIKELDKN